MVAASGRVAYRGSLNVIDIYKDRHETDHFGGKFRTGRRDRASSTWKLAGAGVRCSVLFAEIPANRDPKYFDLGACGPIRTDLADHPELCGIFKAPTLRNVALKKRYFHNGVIKSLRDAVRFYAERDTKPELWYPKNPDGSVAINASRDGLSMEAVDTGVGCPPLRGGGGVGIRGDNAELRFASIVVDPAQ